MISYTLFYDFICGLSQNGRWLFWSWRTKYLYKFESWGHILGLVLLGVAWTKSFDIQGIYYLILGLFLLTFGHSFNDGRKISIVYLLLITILSLSLSFFQILVESILLIMFVLYPFFSKYPFSAFYKGFGWGLLFLLPTNSFNSWYFLVSLLASLSEIFHEAEHHETDKKEGRFTTAHLLNLKISKEGRRKWKMVLMTIGVILLICFFLR